jgi:DNA-binding NtrC family response regulator
MAASGTILIADDEERILKVLARALRGDGHDVVETTSGRSARRLLAERSFDVVVADNIMPDLTGLDLIRELVEQVPPGERPQIVLMTAHATVESAIEAMKLGALDYLQKPFEIDELLVIARRAVELQHLRSQHRYLLNEREEEFDHYGIVGRSRAMQEVIRTLEKVAETKSTVLITGETGTGKELVARAIHDRSAQRDMPLIKVNCAAIPDALLESELFGHVRGAFTGAVTNKKGKFALADGGSILLDEIAMLGQPLQAKLLRVLQEREFEPLGSERAQKVDVRVIAATNRDLQQMVACTSRPLPSSSATTGRATCASSRTPSSGPLSCRTTPSSEPTPSPACAPRRRPRRACRRCGSVRTSNGASARRSGGRWTPPVASRRTRRN